MRCLILAAVCAALVSVLAPSGAGAAETPDPVAETLKAFLVPSGAVPKAGCGCTDPAGCKCGPACECDVFTAAPPKTCPPGGCQPQFQSPFGVPYPQSAAPKSCPPSGCAPLPQAGFQGQGFREGAPLAGGCASGAGAGRSGPGIFGGRGLFPRLRGR